MREKQSDLFELWEAEAQQEKFKQKLLQAEAGDAQAQMFVARGYFYGEGTKRDCAAAIPWLKKAAERDDSLAWFLLGCCYTDGLGVEPNEAEDFACFKRAADLGDYNAMGMIAMYYETGFYVTEDKAKAMQLYKEAAEKGVKIVWLQPNADKPEVVKAAKEAGLEVIEDCVLTRIFAKK